MKRYSLLDSLMVAMVALVGVSELAQVPAIAMRLAHRTAAPLVRLARLGHTPSSPDLPLPAAQPFPVEAQDACARPTEALPVIPAEAPPRVRVAPVIVRVIAIPDTVETIADPVAANAFLPTPAQLRRLTRVRLDVRQIDESRMRAAMVEQQELTQRDVERLVARALAAQARAARIPSPPPSATVRFYSSRKEP
jgi:hypothetical protein